MRRYTVFLLVLIAASIGAQRAYSQIPGIDDRCPTVVVTCPDSDIGPTLTFNANLGGVAPSAKLAFNWTVSKGKIASGQGTSSISVDISGVEGQSLTATVEVGGIPDACGNKASCATNVCAVVHALQFYEYGDLSLADERARLDKFAAELQKRLPPKKSTTLPR